MAKLYYGILLIFLSGFTLNAQTLQGTIRDAATHEVLPGATLYIPDLRSGAASNAEGYYKFERLPKGSFLIQVRLIGYATQSALVDLSTTSTKDFHLEMTSIEKKEVVVTGSAFTTDNKRNSVSVTPVDKNQIRSAGGSNLVNSLTEIPGIAAISTGNGISKPVIRGLSYNRVVVLNEGVRQEGQQWGDEHGLEIDQFAADRIEILKGPGSLLYGSDALGGVINILEPVPAPQGQVRGEVVSQYATNNRLSGNSIMAEGNQQGFIWRTRASYKNAAAFKSPEETIYNTGFREKNVDALAGFHKSWGYSHLHFSRWESENGLCEGLRDSLTGRLLNDQGEIPTEEELTTRKLALPYQKIEHQKISIVNTVILGKSQLRVNGGWQQNDRREFEESGDQAGIHMQLQTATWDLKYYFPVYKELESVIGFSGMSQANENLGEEFLIPDYQLNDFGVFGSVKKSWKKTTINAGLRYDRRYIKTESLVLDSSLHFESFTVDFSSLAASAGITYQASEVINMKLNIGRGFRAPNISELSANGVHEGTFRYEIGDSRLNAETTLQVDAGIAADSKTLSASLELFYNRIYDFTYYRRFGNELYESDGVFYPVYRYVQGNATMAGGEFSVDIHPLDHIHFENSLAYVYGKNTDTDLALPFLPPLTIRNEVRFDWHLSKKSRWKEPYIKFTVEGRTAQKRIDQFESVTNAYTILHLSIGSDFQLGNQTASFFITARNLSDKKYFNHLSRYKEIGVAEMGRNIVLGLNIPFGLKK